MQTDKQLATEILNLLESKSANVDKILELVCSNLIIKDEQLANKLHIALANTTTCLLKHKEDRLNLSNNSLPFAFNYSKLKKLKPENKISWLLDMCESVFPNGKIEGHSEHAKSIFEETINTLKIIFNDKNIYSLEQLFEDFWWLRKKKYVSLLVNENRLL
jgi:hypothetical protein